MFHVRLATDEIRLIVSAPGAVYQAARWIKQFHKSPYRHIGWGDHPGGAKPADVLARHGFLSISRFEFNQIRLLLGTYGPALMEGSFAHLAQNQVSIPVSEMTLLRVASYETGSHAVILNGYWDGAAPELLYVDPAHPDRQFAVELARLRERLDAAAGIHYLSCSSFPKPCTHMRPPPVNRPPEMP